MKSALFSSAAVLVTASSSSLSSSSPPEVYVDLRSLSPQDQLSGLVCTGLLNRNEDSFNGAYSFLDQADQDWLTDITGITSPPMTPLSDFLSLCLTHFPRYVLYDYSTQQGLLPSLITLAAVENAILVESGQVGVTASTLVLDASSAWAGYSVLEATEYMYDHYINETTTMSYMNPGFDNAADPSDPPLTKNPTLGLTDYIVKEKIFNIYLWNACIRNTDQYEFMSKMEVENPWPRPIPVYGYNNAWPVAGDIFEAETNCNQAHNAGQIATDNVNNLSYLNRKTPKTTPQKQNPTTYEVFNSSKTYIMFVMGDGDNVQFLETSRREWMQKRVDLCAEDPSYEGCFPLVWSLSPHLTHLAPDWFDWYYGKALETGHDYFMLPPCGDLYSYPGEFPAEVQENFVHNVERDCEIMSTSGTIEWEWIAHWKNSLENYYPRYNANGVVKGIFAVNVPYNLPAPTIFGHDEYYKMVGDNVALFRPREWRGTSGGEVPFSKHNFLTVDQMAAEINGYELGTVTYVYLTSDGGGSIDNVYELVKELDDHVQVVNQDTLADLAIQRG